jgi:Cytochrome C oxidase, cbb3-type, subunit III
MQTKTRREMATKLMALNLFAFFAVGLAFGQKGPVVRTEIPYEFTVASKVLPAGTYSFSVTDMGLQVQSAAGAAFRAPILTRLGGPTEFLRDGTLVFDKTGDRRILSEVWMPGTAGLLVHSTPKDHSHEILLFSGMTQDNLSGKAAYDRTCRRCHGPDGKGDESADKFFKLTIPRLSSADVQGKSDAELKEIITKGRRAMDPVQIEDAGFRHRLPLQSVDAVIAHVRTLKP